MVWFVLFDCVDVGCGDELVDFVLGGVDEVVYVVYLLVVVFGGFVGLD